MEETETSYRLKSGETFITSRGVGKLVLSMHGIARPVFSIGCRAICSHASEIAYELHALVYLLSECFRNANWENGIDLEC